MPLGENEEGAPDSLYGYWNQMRKIIQKWLNRRSQRKSDGTPDLASWKPCVIRNASFR